VIDESKGAHDATKSPTPAPEVVAPPAAPTTASAPTPPAPAPAVASEASSADSASGVVVSPVVRRILNDGGVEPSTLRGTGPGGSITRRDAETGVAQGPTERSFSHSVTAGAAWVTTCPCPVRARRTVSLPSRLMGPVFAKLDGSGRVTRDGEPISDEMVVSLAAVRALAEFEFLNATYSGDELDPSSHGEPGCHSPIAEDGMLVPVVHAAAGLTLRALARRVNELDERVASRQLMADDLMGGTFTIAGAPTEHTLWANADHHPARSRHPLHGSRTRRAGCVQ